ncbi:MAG: S8 family serine peptidase [Bacteroidia bacterium]|nr:S8 family serine peptidase [Bacteroidia bacterium]
MIIQNCYRALTALLILVVVSCIPEEERQHETGYVESLQMIHAKAFFQQDLRGKGVKIGVVDIGFAGINSDTSLAHLRRNNQIVFVRDLIPKHPVNMFRYSHGTQVLKYIAGIYPDDTLFGGSFARDANFYLIRPAGGYGAKEDARSDELNVDTAFMILDSLGVRLVNMSIGFWNEYTREDENYSAGQMDGKTTTISRICQKWAEKGMIIVNSAGNTGEYAWRIIWAPADAPGVIAVGADRFTDKVFKASYSGIGNPDVSFVKPDLITYTPWGTSFSAPVVTGMIACMLQKDSALTSGEVMDILHKSGSLYPYPNNYVGYGIPDARKILELMDDPDAPISYVKPVKVRDDSFTIATSSQNIVVFDKIDSYRVRHQATREASDGIFVVKRKRRVTYTTVTIGLDEAWEIFWEEPKKN